jgi:hypothetical protein
MQQISRGKFDRLQRTTAGFTDTRFDGYGLRCSSPTRPRVQASYPVLVHRHTPLLHASFRPRLATTPLRFANPSPPSGWIRDFHPQIVEHARHTMTVYGKHGKTIKLFPTLPTDLGNRFTAIPIFPPSRRLRMNISQTFNVPGGGPKQTAEMGQTSLPNTQKPDANSPARR